MARFIFGATALMNLGGPFAGEAMYKVWTQNPSRSRSRLHPGLHQLLPPAVRPVRPDHPGPRAAVHHHQDHHVVLQTGVVVLELVAGSIMMRQSRTSDYGTDETPAQGLFRRSMLTRASSRWRAPTPYSAAKVIGNHGHTKSPSSQLRWGPASRALPSVLPGRCA